MSRSLTVSIVNTRELEMLEPCLSSLYEHPYTNGDFEVVVLNNAAEPGSAAPIEDRFPETRVVEEPRWRGFGANHNRVAEMAGTDLLYVLNPDAVVHEGALDRLAEALAGKPEAAIAAGPILHPDGSMWQSSPFPFPSPLRTLGQALGAHRLAGNHEATTERIFSDRWVSGAAFMIDRDVFLSAGGFDESFFIYSEEIDLMLRLAERGHRIVWVPDALVTHVGRSRTVEETDREETEAAQLEDYEKRRINQYVHSKVAYMQKHRGNSAATAYRVALGFDASLRLAMASIPGLRGLLEERGAHPDATRQHHRTRMRAALHPERGPFISDLALEWNRRIAGPDAGGWT